MKTATMSLEEARELAELTTTIADNLKAIEHSDVFTNDLDDMLEKTTEIVQNLKHIEKAEKLPVI